MAVGERDWVGLRVGSAVRVGLVDIVAVCAVDRVGDLERKAAAEYGDGVHESVITRSRHCHRPINAAY